MEYAALGLVVAFASLLVGYIGNVHDDVKKLSYKLDKIAAYLGMDESYLYKIDDELKKELLDLLDDGKKIKAIKRLRQVSGLGLKESKEYVDRMGN